MDFDEYEYLEKTVENQDDRDNSSRPRRGRDGAPPEKGEKSYRRRDADEDADGEDRKSKRSRNGEEENGSRRDRDRDRDEKDRASRRDKERHRSGREGDRNRDGEREKDRERERSSREKEKEKEKDRERDRERDKEKEREKERERREREKEKERERRERDKEKEREEKERERPRRSASHSRRSPSASRSQRSSSRSLRHDGEFDREREVEFRDNRRFKDKKEAVEPEADPERDQRTVFAYQMPLKAAERDAYEFFSKAGKVRDVRLIMDRNSRRSKGVGYIEFYDAMSVPMAIALSGQLLLGQPVMVKPSEAEKNLVQSTATGASGTAGAYGATDRKLYVGNLHFNMTESHLKSIFEAFGPVELVQLPLDPETGHCKGFGFVQFAQLEHAKAAQSVNGKLEIAGRFLKISSVTDHVGAQDITAKSADLDDDEGGLALNAQSRALLMQKLDRTGIATSIAGSLGVPALNGAPNQQAVNLPLNKQAAVPMAMLPAQVISAATEAVGSPTECLLLKNLFDPATETEPDFDLDIKEDVEEECSKFGRVKHIYVDKNTAGWVYLRFENVPAAMNAQRAMHLRWFAGRSISAIFMPPQEYEAKFKGAA
ncbi:uncharacterized protein LOC115681934 [Syzygium oleosum]|uniref:uncharacterized protein LOC115681934 n=1 Tax=Syzygium oleosum TaxID=219896 RepID=UPI0011D186BD|nr:uncharacterized protein LOC115681934 [Syzygium oleosum]